MNLHSRMVSAPEQGLLVPFLWTGSCPECRRRFVRRSGEPAHQTVALAKVSWPLVLTTN